MARELDFERLEQQFSKGFSAKQREWLAKLLHDHVSGLVSNIVLQVELIDRMMERDMDPTDEFASLKENVRVAAEHLVEIEKSVRRAE